MNVKRIFLIALIALAVFASVSAVSAGWFGFFDGGGGDATVDIIDSSVSYRCYNYANQSNPSQVIKNLTYNGTAKIDVSGVDQDRLKEDLQHGTRSVYVKFGNIANHTSFYVNRYTVEDGILTLYINGTKEIKSSDSVEPGDSGVTEVTGGHVTIYKQASGLEEAYTLTFR